MLTTMLAVFPAPVPRGSDARTHLTAHAGFRLFVRGADASLQSLLFDRAGPPDLYVTSAIRFINGALPSGPAAT